MKKLELLGKIEKDFNQFNDLDIIEIDNRVLVTINDFKGFNEDWEEIDREVNFNEENFYNFLKENCISYEEDFYNTYVFEGFQVEVGYASYDI